MLNHQPDAAPKQSIDAMEKDQGQAAFKKPKSKSKSQHQKSFPWAKYETIRHVLMPKDSQPDNKRARMEKVNGQPPITRENENQNRNANKHSIKNNDV